MPIQTSFVERAAFFTLKLAPSPILDVAGLFAFQAISVAVRQGVFVALAAQPLTPEQLAEQLRCQERGMQMLLEALSAIGYVTQANGRYQNTPLTEKWVLPNDAFNAAAALKPGGQVVILDQIVGNIMGKATNALIRLIAWQYYLLADGRVHERDAIKEWLTQTGFRGIRVINLSKLPGNSLIVAVKD